MVTRKERSSRGRGVGISTARSFLREGSHFFGASFLKEREGANFAIFFNCEGIFVEPWNWIAGFIRNDYRDRDEIGTDRKPGGAL